MQRGPPARRVGAMRIQECACAKHVFCMQNTCMQNTWSACKTRVLNNTQNTCFAFKTRVLHTDRGRFECKPTRSNLPLAPARRMHFAARFMLECGSIRNVPFDIILYCIILYCIILYSPGGAPTRSAGPAGGSAVDACRICARHGHGLAGRVNATRREETAACAASFRVLCGTQERGAMPTV